MFNYENCLQPLCVTGQSVLLGYLADYFSIQNPTDRETRDAYLFALGKMVYTYVANGHGAYINVDALWPNPHDIPSFQLFAH